MIIIKTLYIPIQTQYVVLEVMFLFTRIYMLKALD